MECISKYIYQDLQNPQSARFLRVTLYNNTLIMVEHDSGPLVEHCFGTEDYERFLSDISADAIKKATKANSDSELIEKLHEMFGKNSGFDHFMEFLNSNNIKYTKGAY